MYLWNCKARTAHVCIYWFFRDISWINWCSFTYVVCTFGWTQWKLNWDSQQGRDLATSGHNTKKFNWANLILMLWGKSGIIKFEFKTIYRTRAIISRSRFEAALIYKPRILSLKKINWANLILMLWGKSGIIKFEFKTT